jgi:DnaJ family protein A protein 5
VYRNLFARLAHDESHFDDIVFPSFGYSTWPWAIKSIKTNPRDHEDVKSFYDVWLNFATSKQFSWADQWNLSEAPDRRTRRCERFVLRKTHKTSSIFDRLMERDNKKAREDIRRDFNDAVRVC